MRKGKRQLLFVLLAPMLLLCASLITSCARMGQPDGGWYDDDPPRVVSSVPASQATGVTAKRISILFDEYIKVADATNNVIVSPPQLEMPEIKAAGKRIIVDLKDSLKSNTTYTIDFSDAISDNNEGNPMGNYTFTFSTGERIDTFEVAGNVIEASNLEPVKGILVGMYDDLSDTAFQKKPLMRVARTDGSGRFVIKGVAPGEYRVYALQDADGNYQFSQKSEMLAFSHQIFTPTAAPDVRQDTIWRDNLHIDNILQVTYTHFRPDNVTLLAFQEKQTDRYLLKQPERKDADHFTIYFSYGNENLPEIKGLNFDSSDAFLLEANQQQDTLTYWLRDTTLVKQDTLRMSLTYLATDSTGMLTQQTDTFEVMPKTSYEKRQKMAKREYDEWRKQQERLRKRGEPYDSIMPRKPLGIRYNVAQQMAPNGTIVIEAPAPLTKCDTSAIHLYTKVDSLWYQVPFVCREHANLQRQLEVLAEWQPGSEYSFEVDSAAFADIYGNVADAFKQGLKVKKLDEYATLLMQLSGYPDTCTMVVELLDKNDKAVKQVVADNSGQAEFYYVTPGTYYVRAIADRNNNGIWDTGEYSSDTPPEDVYYYPEDIICKAKFDVTLPWNVTATPRINQKPKAITKQKPDKERQRLRNRNAERAAKLGIPYEK